MRTSEKADARDKSGKHTAYSQQEWIRKVRCDGCPMFARYLYERIAGFGEKGCWMKNETIGEEYGRSRSAVERAITSLWENGYLIITGWNNQSRKMYDAKNRRVKDKLNRECNEALAKGKIKDASDYLAKIRLRVKAEKPQN